ncbi:MAG: hypothetical protein H8E31_02715, partial [Planctomycetes bacterium]|nr:hypothetical protein [Planctomycetota bacterium]
MSELPRQDPSDHAPGDSLSQRLIAERGRKVRLVGRAAMVLALEKAVLEAIRSRLGVRNDAVAEEVVADARSSFFRQLSGRGRAARSFTESCRQQPSDDARRNFAQARVEVEFHRDELEPRREQRRVVILAVHARGERPRATTFCPRPAAP